MLQLAGLVLGIYSVIILGVYFFQDWIVFQSISLKGDYDYPFQDAHQEIWLMMPDGHQINALHFTTNRPKGIILYFHGNRGNLSRWGAMHKDFTTRQYDVLIIDYSGYGKSEGASSEEQLYENARVAYNWALQKYAKEDIIIYGRSLGSAVASHLATQVDSKMLILETPFYNMPETIRQKVPYLWLPLRFKSQFPNNLHLAQVDIPVHIIHGTEDSLVKYASAKKLHPLLSCTTCFVTVEGGGHRNLSKYATFQEYLEKILQ
jgi:pimeloyl-ACP methyl ester carboxylesterase